MMTSKRLLALLLGAVLALFAMPALAAPADSVVLNCWVYYNGLQEQLFSSMVEEFNNTVGEELGVFVEYTSKSTIAELDAKVRASALREPGAEALPDLYAAYADTTFAMRELGVVADISPYLTQEELSEYIDAYIQEGRFGDGSELNIFPAAKATELLMLNQTQWDIFAGDTGADASKLETWEGIAELAKLYFEYTDAATPGIAGDGQAFFGRDSMANYLLIGSMQLGHEIFKVQGDGVTLDFDRDAMRRIWDCYYVPYVYGWFTAEGRYRSDDVKTGKIIALVGSTSGAVYFPGEVTFDDGTTQSIEGSVLRLPNFEGTEPYAVQQGAGFVLTRSDARREKAAVAFLRWFTEPERNIEFSIGSGYLPVTREANRAETVAGVMDALNAKPMVRKIIGVGAEISMDYKLYTNKPFAGGYEARQILNDTLSQAAMDARAQRDALMKDGVAYGDTVAQLVTDEAFEQWYSETKEQLQSAIAAAE